MVFFLPQFIPDLLQVFPFVWAFCVLCAKPLRAHPLAFYLPWTAIVAGATAASMGGFDSTRAAIPLLDTFLNLTSSAVAGVSFYLIVMFIGAMQRGPMVKKLYSIRSEMSVLGGIIIAAHCVRVLPYLLVFTSQTVFQAFGQVGGWFMFFASGVAGVPLMLCFLVPWITSFSCVRKRMSGEAWRKVQKLAYPMMALMVAQGVLLAVGHALAGYPFADQSALYRIVASPASYVMSLAKYVATAWLYGGIGVAYAYLRATRDKRMALGTASRRVDAE
ncbi:hypothetical protein [Curtanaerobium respiraculi]|uniref:hypothetical protein n=1 Tax=Curtanaerobium respiraculi TaxID=2949669 RepID=UPI0024B37F24|nr:hypothetical protein [Curtanaerobium respiraculi]